MITVEYTCPDGTPFPVTFADEADAALEWHIDREHVPNAQAPLAEAVWHRFDVGGARAYEESGMLAGTPPRPSPRANGFAYFTAAPPESDVLASRFEGGAKLIERYGSALAVWEEYCLQHVRETCAWLADAPVESTFQKLADEYDYAMQHTMIAGMLTGNDRRLLHESVTAAMDADGEGVGDELCHGYPSPTLEADTLLWRAAQLADGSDEALAAMESFMQRFGGQATTWCIDSPTLREAPELVAAQVALLRRAGAEDPAASIARAAARREQLVAEIDSRLADDEANRARFHRRVDRAATVLWIREDRALWQLIATGALRNAVLRRGEHLAASGVIATAGDALFLEPEEFDAGRGDLGAEVARRREELDRWRSVLPPLSIGVAPTASAADDVVVRGKAGARGCAAGRARVILDLADAERLEAGDVLVCAMTSPPWTPLFGVAAALVTDGGDSLSHAAIAAREYGLPCVVGTGSATARIPDGAWVRVDGDAGTVELGRP